MTIAVRFGDLSDNKHRHGLIFLDAVTSYDASFSGSVTSHPLEAGVPITDHYIARNPRIKIEGVISSTDISFLSSVVTVDGQAPMNANSPAAPVSVVDIGSGLTQFLPDSITQFIPNTPVTVMGGDSSRNDYSDVVKTFLQDISGGLYYNQDRGRLETRMTLATIYSVNDVGTLKLEYDNAVMVDFDIKETPETGDGLYLGMSFEVVRYVVLAKADAPNPAKPSKTGNQASKESPKGAVPATSITNDPRAPVNVHDLVVDKVKSTNDTAQPFPVAPPK